MSNSSLLPPPLDEAPETLPDNPRPTSPPEFDPETSDAPDWAKAVLREVRAQREETAEIMGESALAMREIVANQELTLAEVRTLSRRVETIERRLGLGDERFKTLEGRLTKIERRLDELEARHVQ